MAGARRGRTDGGCELVAAFEGPIVDVGTGGGVPGVPLAVALPEREVTLLDATERKCAFLREATASLPNVRVVCGRAEEQELEAYGVAVCKALAAPAVAAEWCLPLVRVGGAAMVYAGTVAGDLARVAAQLGAEGPERHAVEGARDRSLLLFRKVAPTPEGFPRRVGRGAQAAARLRPESRSLRGFVPSDRADRRARG